MAKNIKLPKGATPADYQYGSPLSTPIAPEPGTIYGSYPDAPSAPEPTPPPDYSGVAPTAAPAAPPPTKDLATSPEWLAFLNSLGLDREQFSADINRQRGVAQNLATQQSGDITAQGFGSRRGITGGLETRGMARSGQLIRSLADQRASEGRAQGGVQAGLTGTLSGLESSLAQKLIDLHQQQAQQELQMRASGAYT